ncbi:hypothetical protein [Maridesulfovibrio ferrireducens]|uniref:hypothetical protein n=1 Tax=Maridesulfovibrio ferrireducens TaxID=246191 RepID=UPI001A19474B|nr:hypothetical protein [Maridesulfovibrio ferrireducens]MBI9110313.1 hypothetical protein [Maridesulfovibrio ferrireducens]
MSPFNMIPYLEFDGVRSFADSFIALLYERCEFEGHSETVFYEGTIRNETEFVKALKSSVTWLVVQDEVIVAVIWLTRHEGKFARFHFITFQACARRHLVKMGQYVLREIMQMKDNSGKFTFDMLLGSIPARNRGAVNYAKKCGGKVCGELPNGAWIEREGKSENAILIAVTREILS